MNVLWDRKSATVSEVVEALPRRLALAYSTVLTTLRILEQKGYIQHSKEGRAFVYFPIVDRGEARRSALNHLLSRFFEDSPHLLVLNILDHDKIDGEELKRLKKLIRESE
jgi:predicted transcriptional regulator